MAGEPTKPKSADDTLPEARKSSADDIAAFVARPIRCRRIVRGRAAVWCSRSTPP